MFLHSRTYLHYRGAIVGDGLSALIIDQQQVPTIGAQRALDRRLHRQTGIDVGDDLTLSLRSIRAYSIQGKVAKSAKSNHVAWHTYGGECGRNGPSLSTTIVGAWPAKAMVTVYWSDKNR